MYAIFQSGGKQYRVSNNQVIRLEKLNIATGKIIEFSNIMMIVNGDNIQIGCPFIKGSKITAEVIAHSRGNKVVIIKFRRRKHFLKHQGHRQWFTDIKITGINTIVKNNCN